MTTAVKPNLVESLLLDFLKTNYCGDYSDKLDAILNGPTELQGTFKNGNMLFALAAFHQGGMDGLYVTTSPSGDVISIFSVYEGVDALYREKADIFVITGHETTVTVNSDGSQDTDYTR